MASGAPGGVAADRMWTVPNALSVLRLLGVPVFFWLLLGLHADVAALILLAVSGATDWADGVLARRWNQTSRLGALLDPAADRLYILATLVGLTLRDIIPAWLAAVIIGRDLLLGLTLPVLRRSGYGPPPVHYLLLLAARDGTVADIARPIAWAFTVWGTALYLWAGVLYVGQVAQLTRKASA